MRVAYSTLAVRATAAVLLAVLCARHEATGQDAPGASDVSPLVEPAAEEAGWSFLASAYAYFIPNEQDYVQPTVAADRGWLHLEARYNYEALETGSAWLGYNLAGGRKLAWELTPLLGGVFGETTGVAPGYKGSLSWWRLELYSEGEWVIDTGDTSESFFYNWSELTFAPVDGFRFGLVTQRTRAYAGERDIQRGLLVGVTYRCVDLTTCLFNPDDGEATVVVAVSVEF